MTKQFALVVLAALGQASAVTVSNIDLTSVTRINTIYMLQADVTVPAVFPKPAVSAKIAFNCAEGIGVTGLDEAERPAFLKNAGVKVTKTSFQVGTLKGVCRGLKLTVSDPALIKAWTTDRTDPGLLSSAVSWSARVPRPIAWTQDRSAFVIEGSGYSSSTFTAVGGLLRVLRGASDSAISVSQNGQPLPLWVAGTPSKAAKINTGRPFTVHITDDGGARWDNVMIDLTHNTVARWQSLRIPGGKPPSTF